MLSRKFFTEIQKVLGEYDRKVLEVLKDQEKEKIERIEFDGLVKVRKVYSKFIKQGGQRG